ncbi:hypothetical protein XELAEV_18014373mg [Xenopus laevis]|uniref:Uncharacterized protein n=1 Tax=Xenopus laevis TaxID=8355 RepID=A0A974HUX7_XENLA|nr:hypothetical protein XELAEV_18014373mg [Xenopus laevis]
MDYNLLDIHHNICQTHHLSGQIELIQIVRSELNTLNNMEGLIIAVRHRLHTLPSVILTSGTYSLAQSVSEGFLYFIGGLYYFAIKSL